MSEPVLGRERPYYWNAWSGEEQRLWQQRNDAYLRMVTDAERALTRALGEAHAPLLDAYEQATVDYRLLSLQLVAARLRRLRPDLADLVQWAVDVSGVMHEVDAPCDQAVPD